MRFFIVFMLLISILSSCSSTMPDASAPPETRNKSPEPQNPDPDSQGDTPQNRSVPSSPITEVVPPAAPEAEQPAPEPEIISEASTPIYDDSSNRVNNMKIAADTINETVLAPGEIFSFNDTVGKRTAEKGYKSAPILYHGKHKKGVGGGVCQISTTLYLAVEDCGLEIVERHKHDKEVAYSPGGKDSTVNYGSLDFKFKNTCDRPVKINLSVGEESVSAKLSKC